MQQICFNRARWVKTIDLPEGQIMPDLKGKSITPRSRNTIFSLSSLQLPRVANNIGLS